MLHDVVILSRARTPIGSFNGGLSRFSAPELGAAALKVAVERAGLSGNDIGEVLMGQVLTAGVGQAPARQAALRAEIPASVPCTTVNKVCGSGLKAVMLGAQAILLGEAQIVAAGGMESMTQAPYLLPKARFGYRLGSGQVLDAILQDGLSDPYTQAHMGTFGDQCAAEFAFSRADQDDFAKISYERALNAHKNGYFKNELAFIGIEEDEEPKNYKPEKMPVLKPAFGPSGTVTVANASKINDGAAALVLASGTEAQKRGLKPLAKIIGTGTFAQEPARFTTAPIGAIQKAVQNAGILLSDIEYFEINEAFSTVTMACTKELNLSAERVNVWGGAVALGHPIGSSGARILCTLISVLQHHQAKYGCAAICLGGGEAVAVIVENMLLSK
ncbi:MAG: acetyl-CoA C-acyltransferase [Myxococcota bacterium]